MDSLMRFIVLHPAARELASEKERERERKPEVTGEEERQRDLARGLCAWTARACE